VLPTYDEQAQDLPVLLAAIAQDEAAAIEQYGHRSGTGPYSFMVRGEAQVVALDTTSRSGIITLDLAPPDGTVDASMVIGPLIKVSQRSAVRDAVGFIEYGAFTTSKEFADVATAMGDRITAMIAEALGLDDVEAIREMDPRRSKGKTVQFVGAFSLDGAARSRSSGAADGGRSMSAPQPPLGSQNVRRRDSARRAGDEGLSRHRRAGQG